MLNQVKHNPVKHSVTFWAISRHYLSMNERDLIKRIEVLKGIQPDKTWLVLTKERILGQPAAASPIVSFRLSLAEVLEKFDFLWEARPALVSFVFLAALGLGSFSLAQTSLPGDPLYPVKKLTEKIGVMLVSEKNQPKAQLELATRRLEELKTIAQNSQLKNLAPALLEYKESVAQAASNLKKAQSAPQPELVREIASAVQKMDTQKKKVEALGVVVGESEELNEALVQLAENEIKNLENRSLNEEQEGFLVEAKTRLAEGNYSAVLEIILQIGYPEQ